MMPDPSPVPQAPVAWYRLPAVWGKRLYNWMIHWADTPYGVPALFCLSFAESSFFPIPPDVLLMALAMGQPARSYYFALICSAGSVLGGLAGYMIGYFFWEAVHGIFIPHVFSQELFDMVCRKYQEESFLIVFLAAFTPIPYKVITIAGGVCQISVPGFLLASAVGRSGRFFIVSTVFYFFGAPAKKFIDKYFEALSLAFGVLLVLGFVAAQRYLK